MADYDDISYDLDTSNLDTSNLDELDASNLDYNQKSNYEWFISSDNIQFLARTFYRLNNKSSVEFWIEEIPDLIDNWIITQKVNKLFAVTDDWIEYLDYLNNNFIKQHKYLFTNFNEINPSRSSLRVGVINEYGHSIVEKPGKEILAHEFQTLDFKETNDNGNKDIYAARIQPIYRMTKYLHKRNYERESEGLRNTVETSSRDTILPKFDMSDILYNARARKNKRLNNLS
jgi:hypothetical protein